jgi:hypothetical protein
LLVAETSLAQGVDAIVKIIFSSALSAALLALIAVGVMALRRTWRGKKAVSDDDWRLLFGKPKGETLTAHYVMRLGFGFAAGLVLGLVEYMILFPFGAAWYGVSVIITTLVIIYLTATWLR